MSQIESVHSRDLGQWLYTLASVLESMRLMGLMLGFESASPSARASDIEAVAGWLYDAKFEIRDPWRLKVAVRDVLKFHESARPRDAKAGVVELEALMTNLKREFEPFRGTLL